MNVSKWFEDKIGIHTAHSRMSFLLWFFGDMRKAGLTQEDITEEIAYEILSHFSPDVPPSMKSYINNLIIAEMSQAIEIAMGERPEIEEEPEPVISKAPDREEVYTEKEWTEIDEEEAKEKIKVDKSELRKKEFDMDVLNELGINIEDLGNE